MENSEIAKIFWNISEILTLKQENPFKIRAYQKAAQTIENLSENAIDAINNGTKIPGVGENISSHILEISKTGSFKEYDKLLKSFPQGFLELQKISGLGPKGAILLYKKLKVKNIGDLEKAAKSGKIRHIEGMGAKKEENIIKGIEQYRKRKGRFLLSDASAYADAIIEYLKTQKDTVDAIAAGSLRRGKETVGDIDILVTAKNPKKVMDSFVKIPYVKDILSFGSTKSSVILKTDIHVDLRVIDPKSYGAALHYFTGSKAHNIKIRELAIKEGLKISEYGVFSAKEKFITGLTEEDVFKSVGLPFIPPELREDRGEFEAGLANKLPKLVELKDIIGDLHTHTNASDGANTIEEMVLYAKNIGYKYIAITDHSISSRIAGGLSEDEMIKRWKQIDMINDKISGIRILKGVEVDISKDGTLDYSDKTLKQADVVLAAIHSNFKMGKDAMTKRVAAALNNKYVNILAHPTGRLLSMREPFEIDLESIINTASMTGTCIEINAHPERLDLDDIHCKRAKEKGVFIAVNSDAHTTDGMDFMSYGVTVARRGWLEKNNVINTFTLEKLLEKLYAKRI